MLMEPRSPAHKNPGPVAAAVSNKQGTDQWSILAALRFFLAMVVLTGHCSFLVAGRHDWTFIGLWLNQGSAVFGFFIISGFSIAASLTRETSHFYQRRFIRIWPLYLSCIAVGLIAVACFPNRGIVWPSGFYMPPTTSAMIIASLLMLQTIVAPAIPSVGAIWSLSPEWCHYMIAPLLRKCHWIVLFGWMFVSFMAFMLIPSPAGSGPEGFNHGLGFLTLSWLWVSGFVYYQWRGTSIGFCLLTFPSILALFFNHFTGLPLFITIFVVILCGEIRLPAAFRRPFGWLGDVSYPLYLFHPPVIFWCLYFGVFNTLLIVPGALFAAVAALYLIDRPFSRILSKMLIGTAKRSKATHMGSS